MRTNTKLLIAITLISGVSIYFALQETPLARKRVLLVVALQEEAAPIIAQFNLKKVDQPFNGLPMEGYKGQYKKLDLFMVLNGEDPIHQVPQIGTQAATLATQLGIGYFNPSLVINVGTAGGISQHGAKLGEVYLSDTIYFHDRRMPLPGYSNYGKGGYQSYLIDIKPKGNICTGNSFDKNPTDYEMAIKLGCIAQDMESASVAWVSALHHKPMFALKGVSDLVESSDGQGEFEKNLSSVSEKLAVSLKGTLDHISSINSPEPN